MREVTHNVLSYHVYTTLSTRRFGGFVRPSGDIDVTAIICWWFTIKIWQRQVCLVPKATALILAVYRLVGVWVGWSLSTEGARDIEI